MENILWVNPSFLDYRIPLYSELNSSLSGRFHLIYSKERIPERCHTRICKELGANAHFIEKEKRLNFGKPSAEFANTSVSIPLPTGLYKLIKSVRPKAIIAEGFFQFTPWAVVYSFLHRIPLYIAYERTAHTERNCPIWRKLYRRFIGMFVRGYIANGVLTKEYLMSQGVKENAITTGGMCADSEQLRKLSSNLTEEEKLSFESSIGLDKKSGLRYIYVGQIIERKGVNYLLEAWKNHTKAFPGDELLIVGDGPLLTAYKTIYGEETSVRFLGGVDYSLIYKYYAISDVFVIPTLEDNWSLVVPEAMACGLPVACSVYNGCHPELVRHDVNGTIFDPLNHKSTLNALAYFHHNDIMEMGCGSREIEQEFSPERVSENIISMVKKHNAGQ